MFIGVKDKHKEISKVQAHLIVLIKVIFHLCNTVNVPNFSVQCLRALHQLLGNLTPNSLCPPTAEPQISRNSEITTQIQKYGICKILCQ